MKRKEWEVLHAYSGANIERGYSLDTPNCKICQNMRFYNGIPKCVQLMQETTAGTITFGYICDLYKGVSERTVHN